MTGRFARLAETPGRGIQYVTSCVSRPSAVGKGTCPDSVDDIVYPGKPRAGSLRSRVPRAQYSHDKCTSGTGQVPNPPVVAPRTTDQKPVTLSYPPVPLTPQAVSITSIFLRCLENKATYTQTPLHTPDSVSVSSNFR